MQAYTVASGQVVVIASGRPLSPSQTAMHISATPRFFSSVNLLRVDLPRHGDDHRSLGCPSRQALKLGVSGQTSYALDRIVPRVAAG
jgi:hypothetical protein